MVNTEEGRKYSSQRSSSWERRMREEFEAKLQEQREAFNVKQDLSMEMMRKFIKDKLSPLKDKKRVKAVKKKQEDVKSSTIKKVEDEILKLPKAKCALSSEFVQDLCDPPFGKIDVVLENDQACEQLNSLEPVMPSSTLSFSQVLEEKSQKEAPRSLPLNCDLEQPPKLVPESFPKPILHDYPRKHSKEFDLART